MMTSRCFRASGCFPSASGKRCALGASALPRYYKRGAEAVALSQQQHQHRPRWEAGNVLRAARPNVLPETAPSKKVTIRAVAGAPARGLPIADLRRRADGARVASNGLFTRSPSPKNKTIPYGSLVGSDRRAIDRPRIQPRNAAKYAIRGAGSYASVHESSRPVRPPCLSYGLGPVRALKASQRVSRTPERAVSLPQAATLAIRGDEASSQGFQVGLGRVEFRTRVERLVQEIEWVLAPQRLLGHGASAFDIPLRLFKVRVSFDPLFEQFRSQIHRALRGPHASTVYRTRSGDGSQEGAV